MNDRKDDINEIQERLKSLSFSGWRILITGGAGFLGSWLAEVLLLQGASVLVIDNFASGKKESVNRLRSYKNFELLNHDISRPIDISMPLDAVLHLASRASPLEFSDYPIQILKSNTIGTMYALGIAKRHDSRFLFTSTSEIYGQPDSYPTKETCLGSVNTLGPRGCYDEAKRAGEALCMAYYRQHGIDTRIVRIFNTYGPGMRSDGVYGRVIPRFIDQASQNRPLTIFGDGTQTRSFCYITDMIAGLLTILGEEKLGGEVFNLGNPHEVTIKYLADTIIQLTGSSSNLEYHPLPEDDPLRRLPDITKIQRLTDWKPEVSLETGLKKVVKASLSQAL